MTEFITQQLPEHLQVRRRAERREVIVQLGAVLLAVGCFVCAGMLVLPINAIRQEKQLVIDSDSIAGLPPDLALLGKLGTFRALAIDWASIRADRLKEQGKMYEAYELHNTICMLAPRFPKVWANASWNMAYNISVTQFSPEERWKWVSNGLKLLRDKGLKYNPKSITLYRELAWTYYHKVGDILDDEHRNYKRALAVELERVLGPPPITVEDEEYFAWFKEIVDAPRDLAKLVREDTEIAAFILHLRDVRLTPDLSFLEAVARHERPGVQVFELLEDTTAIDRLVVKQIELLKDPNWENPRRRLIAAVRSSVLRDEMKFDLDWLFDLMVNQFGPLDLRNPFTHTLYWASWGDKVCRDHENNDRTDAINTARIVLFALNSIVVRGKTILWPDFDVPFNSYIDFTPDTRLIPYLYNSYMRLGKEHTSEDPRYIEGTPGPIFFNGFVSNMENWVQLLYLDGGERNLKLAENYYAWLRKYNPHPDGSTQERYTQTLQQFVMGDLLNQLHTNRAATGLIGTFIHKALKQIGLGLKKQGLASIRHAKLAHEYWLKDAGVQINDRMRLQPLEIMMRDQVEEFMQIPELSPVFKVRLWKGLPLQQRQMIYDRLQPYFAELCKAQSPPWKLKLAFGEPPGMEEFRKRKLKTIGKSHRENVEEGTRYKP